MTTVSKDCQPSFAESRLPMCVPSIEWNSSWDNTKAELVRVSGDREVGGGVVVDPSLLPGYKLQKNEFLVLSADHLVEGKKHVQVGQYDEKGVVPALTLSKVLYSDPAVDLALLSVINDKGGVPARLMKYADLRASNKHEWTVAFRPEENKRSLSMFQIRSVTTYGALGGSAARREFAGLQVGDEAKVVVLSPADLPGTSGSPLVANDGKIVGIVSQRLPLDSRLKFHRPANKNKISWTNTVAVSPPEIKVFFQNAELKFSGQAVSGRNF